MIGHARRTPINGPRRVLRWRVLLAGAALAAASLMLAHILDPHILALVPTNNAGAQDWARALRVLGYLPTWLVIALTFFIVDTAKVRDGEPIPVFRRPLLTVVGAGAPGLASELLKMLLRRERPPADTHLHQLTEWPGYTFRPFAEAPFSSAGLGLPSGHAAVAMGGMLMLCYLHPRASLLFILLAAGTALTRILAEAHYLSDVVLSWIIAWIVVRALLVTNRLH